MMAKSSSPRSKTPIAIIVSPKGYETNIFSTDEAFALISLGWKVIKWLDQE